MKYIARNVLMHNGKYGLVVKTTEFIKCISDICSVSVNIIFGMSTTIVERNVHA